MQSAIAWRRPTLVIFLQQSIALTADLIIHSMHWLISSWCLCHRVAFFRFLDFETPTCSVARSAPAVGSVAELQSSGGVYWSPPPIGVKKQQTHFGKFQGHFWNLEHNLMTLWDIGLTYLTMKSISQTCLVYVDRNVIVRLNPLQQSELFLLLSVLQ